MHRYWREMTAAQRSAAAHIKALGTEERGSTVPSFTFNSQPPFTYKAAAKAWQASEK